MENADGSQELVTQKSKVAEDKDDCSVISATTKGSISPSLFTPIYWDKSSRLHQNEKLIFPALCASNVSPVIPVMEEIPVCDQLFSLDAVGTGVDLTTLKDLPLDSGHLKDQENDSCILSTTTTYQNEKGDVALPLTPEWLKSISTTAKSTMAAEADDTKKTCLSDRGQKSPYQTNRLILLHNVIDTTQVSEPLGNEHPLNTCRTEVERTSHPEAQSEMSNLIIAETQQTSDSVPLSIPVLNEEDTLVQLTQPVEANGQVTLQIGEGNEEKVYAQSITTRPPSVVSPQHISPHVAYRTEQIISKTSKENCHVNDSPKHNRLKNSAPVFIDDASNSSVPSCLMLNCDEQNIDRSVQQDLSKRHQTEENGDEIKGKIKRKRKAKTPYSPVTTKCVACPAAAVNHNTSNALHKGTNGNIQVENRGRTAVAPATQHKALKNEDQPKDILPQSKPTVDSQHKILSSQTSQKTACKKQAQTGEKGFKQSRCVLGSQHKDVASQSFRSKASQGEVVNLSQNSTSSVKREELSLLTHQKEEESLNMLISLSSKLLDKLNTGLSQQAEEQVSKFGGILSRLRKCQEKEKEKLSTANKGRDHRGESSQQARLTRLKHRQTLLKTAELKLSELVERLGELQKNAVSGSTIQMGKPPLSEPHRGTIEAAIESSDENPPAASTTEPPQVNLASTESTGETSAALQSSKKSKSTFCPPKQINRKSLNMPSSCTESSKSFEAITQSCNSNSGNEGYSTAGNCSSKKKNKDNSENLICTQSVLSVDREKNMRLKSGNTMEVTFESHTRMRNGNDKMLSSHVTQATEDILYRRDDLLANSNPVSKFKEGIESTQISFPGNNEKNCVPEHNLEWPPMPKYKKTGSSNQAAQKPTLPRDLSTPFKTITLGIDTLVLQPTSADSMSPRRILNPDFEISSVAQEVSLKSTACSKSSQQTLLGKERVAEKGPHTVPNVSRMGTVVIRDDEMDTHSPSTLPEEDSIQTQNHLVTNELDRNCPTKTIQFNSTSYPPETRPLSMLQSFQKTKTVLENTATGNTGEMLTQVEAMRQQTPPPVLLPMGMNDCVIVTTGKNTSETLSNRRINKPTPNSPCSTISSCLFAVPSHIKLNNKGTQDGQQSFDQNSHISVAEETGPISTSAKPPVTCHQPTVPSRSLSKQKPLKSKHIVSLLPASLQPTSEQETQATVSTCSQTLLSVIPSMSASNSVNTYETSVGVSYSANTYDTLHGRVSKPTPNSPCSTISSCLFAVPLHIKLNNQAQDLEKSFDQNQEEHGSQNLTQNHQELQACSGRNLKSGCVQSGTQDLEISKTTDGAALVSSRLLVSLSAQAQSSGLNGKSAETNKAKGAKVVQETTKPLYLAQVPSKGKSILSSKNQPTKGLKRIAASQTISKKSPKPKNRKGKIGLNESVKQGRIGDYFHKLQTPCVASSSITVTETISGSTCIPSTAQSATVSELFSGKDLPVMYKPRISDKLNSEKRKDCAKNSDCFQGNTAAENPIISCKDILDMHKPKVPANLNRNHVKDSNQNSNCFPGYSCTSFLGNEKPTELSSGPTLLHPCPVLKFKTVRLIQDSELCGEGLDLEGFWSEDFSDIRMAQEFWNSVDVW